MRKYDYLKKYINFDKFDGKRAYNWFEKVSIDEIINAEKRLGFSFPQVLKEFWLEIGRGSLPNPIDIKDDFIAEYNNHIFSPQNIADIIILKEESGYVLPTVFDNEFFEEGDIPFFEICDMQFFLVMKPNSDKPDAVYDIDKPGVVIEEHFERFIWRLYHESPDYYLHVDPKLAK